MAHTPQVHIPWLHQTLQVFFSLDPKVNPQWKSFSDAINILEPQEDFRALNEHLRCVTFLNGDLLTPDDLYVLCRIRLIPAWKRVITNKNRPPFLARWYLHVNSLLCEHSVKPDYKERVHFDLRLHAAIESNDLELAQRLLKVVNIEERDAQNRGIQAIHVAAMKGSLRSVELLLAHGVNIDSEDSEGMTPLFYAAYRGKLDLLHYLLSKGANASHIEHQGRTAVYWAANTGKTAALQILISHGCDPNVKTRLGRSALSKAAWSAQIEVVKVLCELPNVRLDEGDSKGRTPLHNAVWGESGGRAGKKLAFGNTSDSPECASILITSLKSRGLSIDLPDRSGNTPLCIAASTNAPKSVSLLLHHGANILHRNKYRNTPIHEAVRRGHLTCAKLILETGCVSVNLPGYNDLTPLLTTITCGQLVMCRYLLTFAEVEVREKAVELSIQYQEKEVLKVILGKYYGKLKEEFILKAIEMGNMDVLEIILNSFQSISDFSILAEAAKICPIRIFCLIFSRFLGEISSDLYLFASHNSDLLVFSFLFGKIPLTSEDFLTILSTSSESHCVLLVEKVPHMWSVVDGNTQETPLHKACFRGFSLLVDRLLTASGTEYCEFIARKDAVGLTAYANAVMNRHLSIAAYLEEIYRKGSSEPLETCIVSLSYTDIPHSFPPNPIPLSAYPATYPRLTPPCKQLHEANLEFITTQDQLKTLENLSLTWTAIGLDMEYYSFDEKRGTIALIQISDGQTDFVIDPFQCEVGEFMRKLMGNEKCLKVLHGADSDLIWLQMDYEAFAVNVFDTARAHRVVTQEPGLSSLAKLLDLYLHISLDKLFQIADWRIRPLPPCMLSYARHDSHYLLPLYSTLTTSMTDSALLETALLCNKLCRKTPSLRHQRIQLTVK